MVTDSTNNDAILKDYDAKSGALGDFADAVQRLIVQILSAHGIRVHSVTPRLKKRDSLKAKLAKPEATYRKLADITDVAGVRVITYFADDVDRIAALIEREFAVDRENSIDKRASLDPDRFGYLSLHHIVKVDPRRAALPEYQRFPNFVVEIQTRSILQHAWAELEHDLGYKTTLEVPRHLRRRFSRLAGLLELADQEFQLIRDELKSYEKSLPRAISEKPRAVSLDKASFARFISTSAEVARVDKAISRACNVPLLAARESESSLQRLLHVGMTNLEQVEKALRSHRSTIPRFARIWAGRQPRMGRPQHGGFARGVSLFYLAYVLLAEARDTKALGRFVQRFFRGEKTNTFAKRLFESYAKARSRKPTPATRSSTRRRRKPR